MTRARDGWRAAQAHGEQATQGVGLLALSSTWRAAARAFQVTCSELDAAEGTGKPSGRPAPRLRTDTAASAERSSVCRAALSWQARPTSISHCQADADARGGGGGGGGDGGLAGGTTRGRTTRRAALAAPTARSAATTSTRMAPTPASRSPSTSAPVKAKYPQITYADLYQLAGVVAVEVTGGPVVDFVPGRKDSLTTTPDKRLPDAGKGAPHLRDVFYRMGLNDKDIVALSGGHAIGRAHKERSGFEGAWTKQPLKFDNSYFQELLNGETAGLLQLPTDKCLVEDPAFRPYVELYAKDEEAFFSDYAASHKKLSELGCKDTSPAFWKSEEATASPSTILAQSAVGVAATAVVLVLSYLYELRRRARFVQ
eukprot:SM000140S00596  [mRNA]  locus=s140:100359:103623:+ [translate_table: standard]